MVDFGSYKKSWFLDFLWPAGFPASLVFSAFGQFCASERLEILDAKIGSVPVRRAVASLAFPASSASLP